MEATIKFKNGTEIEAKVNADCYITDVKPDFPSDMTGLVIEREDGNKEYDDPILIECASVDGKYWFAFNEKPEEQILKEEIRQLQMQNEFLEGCIMEMSEEVYK